MVDAQVRSVVVSAESVADSDPASVVASNVSFVNALRQDGLLKPEEIHVDALRSYYVDFFATQMNNGGFSQFVYNLHGDPHLLRLVSEGLRAMGATRHLTFLDRGAARVADLGKKKLKRFLTSEYFGKNRVRDELNEDNDAFYEAQADEDLNALHAAWLKGLPHLTVVPRDTMADEVERLASAVPDRADRLARARSEEPHYLRAIRALCEESSQVLSRVTAGDPTHVHAGETTLAWHFLTDQGHHYMVEADGEAVMFDGTTHARVAHVTI